MESVIQKAEGLLAGWIPTAGSLDIPLSRRAIYRLDGDRRGVSVTCLDGTVWITQPEDPADYLLNAGQSFSVERPGIVLIQGLPDGRVRLAPVFHGSWKVSDGW